MQAIQVCRSRFQPLEQLSQPYVMVGLNAFAAATDEEARYLKTSAQQLILNLRRGQPGRLPPPVADFESQLTPLGWQFAQRTLQHDHQKPYFSQ